MPAGEKPRRTAPRFLAQTARLGLFAGVFGAGVAAWAGEPSAGLSETPLAPRSRAAGATLFTSLPPEQTGIANENTYADPEMWGELNREFALGAIGTGIAIGDYDNDGRPDLFVVSKTGQSRLFRNLGGWKFEDVTAAVGLARSDSALDQGLSWVKNLVGSSTAGSPNPWTQGAAFADVNNDGWLDLYVCRFGAPNLLFINQRSGKFAEEAGARGLALVDSSGMGNFCDYDRDGWLDVYIQTNLLDATKAPNGQRDHLFRNRGDGTFDEVTERAGISGESLAHSATWWDYNEDGWPDLYVANDFEPHDKLYRNNRDGTFTNVIHDVVPQTSYSAMGTDQGDVNNDGRIDMFVADMAATTHEQDQRSMAAARELIREDADSTTVAPQILRNTLFLSTGFDRFLEAGALAGVEATDWTWAVRFEDLDNDGRLDLYVTNGMVREYNNVDLRNEVILRENPDDRLRVMKDSPVLNERNLAYRNTGDLRFEETGKAWGLDQKGVSFGAAFGDLDGDGDLDLVFSNYEAPASVMRNDSPAGHRVVVALRGASSNRFGVGAIARIETAAGVQVRQLLVGRGYLSSSEPVLHFGLGEAERIDRLTIEWPSGHRQEFTNLAGDRRYTITEPAGPAVVAGRGEQPGERRPPDTRQFVDESAARGLSIRSEETFIPDRQPLLPTRFDRRGPALAVADLNGDGRDDVAIGGTGRQPGQLLTAGPRFSPAGSLGTSALDDGPVLLFDANGDGDIDVLQTRAGTNRNANSPEFQPVLHGNEAGRFAPVNDALPPMPNSVGAAVAADFNRDGRLDVFLGGRVLPGRYPTSPKSALLRNAGGHFEDVTDALAEGLREVGMVSSALWSDVDQDGWPDLLLALEWGGVRFWRNQQGRGFEDWSERAGFTAAGTGWWTSLASADFNGDSRPDFVVGNVGLNTTYRAPAVLFHGQFGSGPPQVIEASYHGDALYPRRTLRTLSAVIPALRRQFPKNNDFAKAPLTSVLDPNRLAKATRYEATELRSGVFLSQPDGKYRFDPLPRMAQISIVQGLAAGDFDGDGHADIYAVQNSYAPIPSIGRFDGGLSQLLLGDGRGGFRVAPPLESGLVVPGDAKALVVLDLDDNGWPDFLVSRNDSTTIAWRNQGVSGRRSFRVILQGAAGNPTAIGARLALELADGTRQQQELHAGAGYYSQSASGAFFGYPESNPPRRLAIRWPDGNETAHEFAAPPPSLLKLSAP